MLMTLSTLVSSIGGNLGLFVGFSFLTVFRLIYKPLIEIWRGKKAKKLKLTSDNKSIEGMESLPSSTLSHLKEPVSYEIVALD